MITKGNEYFYQVSGLVVPKYEVGDSFPERLEYFTTISRSKAQTLELLAECRDIERIVAEIEDVDKLLCDIHAYMLETETARILRLSDVDGGNLVYALIPQLIRGMDRLAAEIQFMQNEAFNEQRRQYDTIERSKLIITKLKSMLTLARNSEFDKIFDMVMATEELHTGDKGIEFIACLTSQYKEGLDGIINDFLEKFTKRIHEQAGTEVTVLKNVLIVDDQPEILSAMSQMLREHYQVFALSDGNQALNFLEKHDVDAFILDIDMPVMDGYELAKRIKQTERNRFKPIIFLTGNTSKEYIMKAVLYGAKDFIAKPIVKDVVLERLGNMLNS